MDPLSALSIASAIVSFIDFTLGVLKDTAEIRGFGTLAAHEDWNIVLPELQRLNETLRSTSVLACVKDPAVNEHETALAKLSESCQGVAKELVDVIEALEYSPEGKRLKSFYRALKSRWETSKIENLNARLKEYKSQLQLTLIACLNSKIDFYGKYQLEKMERSQAQIIEVLAFNHLELVGILAREQSQGFNNRSRIQTTHAILTTSNGETQTIRGEPENQITSTKSFPQVSGTVTRWDKDQRPPNTIGFSQLSEAVLNCLDYRHIQDRYDSVVQAQSKTFSWIFQDPKKHLKPWDNFSQWLRGPGQHYWINGKPASGKSTLMKYIYQNKKTQELLHQWAGRRELVIVPFFFWYLGTSLQKSQAGLLRTLIHDALRHQPELIPEVAPELCRFAINGGRLDEPTLPELKRWLSRLIECTTATTAIVFMIDGVDEYSGDYLELIQYLQELSHNAQHLKLILSSRPIPACFDAFKSYPGLRLQDLTFDDMVTFTDSRIGASLCSMGGQYSAIITDIAHKAEGVFLWTVLATRSLISGIQNGDTINELRQRLEELPGELKELFSHMLRKVPERYRNQALKLLHLVLASLDVETRLYGHPISAIKMSFVEEEWDTICSMSISPMDMVEVSRRQENISLRVSSRCCGLLEIHEFPSSTKRATYVQFIHKTVVEYLQSEDNLLLELQLCIDSQFEAWRPLFSASLAMIKAFSPVGDAECNRESSHQPAYLYAAVDYALLAQNRGSSLPASYLQEMDTVVTKFWSDLEIPKTIDQPDPWAHETYKLRQWYFSTNPRFSGSKYQQCWPLLLYVDWPRGQHPRLQGQLRNRKTCYYGPIELVDKNVPFRNARLLAVFMGLHTFLNESLQSMGFVERIKESTVLLQSWFSHYIDGYRNFAQSYGPLPSSFEIISCLLDNGADVNAPFQHEQSILEQWSIFHWDQEPNASKLFELFGQE